VAWSGQFEYMERAIEKKMMVVIPVTLLSIFLLLYLNFRRITETQIVMLSVPFALVVIPAIYALVKQWRLKKGLEG